MALSRPFKEDPRGVKLTQMHTAEESSLDLVQARGCLLQQRGDEDAGCLSRDRLCPARGDVASLSWAFRLLYTSYLLFGPQLSAGYSARV